MKQQRGVLMCGSLQEHLLLPGMEKAGAGPSQELVDSYEMIDGTQPILGYSDSDHLHPIINKRIFL